MTKSHFCASDAGPTLMSRASPSKRSMTIPLASGKCLSGSASTTSPTVHFQPLAADLYAPDLFTSSLKSEAHSSENALTPICSSRSRKPSSRRLLRADGVARGDQSGTHHPAVDAHEGVAGL